MHKVMPMNAEMGRKQEDRKKILLALLILTNRHSQAKASYSAQATFVISLSLFSFCARYKSHVSSYFFSESELGK